MKNFWLGLLSLGLISGMSAQTLGTGLSDGVWARLVTTKGEILIQLDFQQAPLTVSNFVGLAEGSLNLRNPGKPFYDGLTFHRVEPGFVVQGGDPNGNGSGGPGYFFPDEIVPDLKHDAAGVLGMANVGPDTNGSQFYISLVPLPQLDGRYSVFGKVVQGLDVAMKIAQNDVISKIVILRQGGAAQAFRPTVESFSQLTKAVADQKDAQQKDLLAQVSEGTQTTASGLRWMRLKEGSGKKAQAGQLIAAHYEGKLLNGVVFDSSWSRGQPIQFVVGRGQVIKGWDEALVDMTVGEKRKLVIPPELGYGSRGAAGVIPPNSWLIFTVELISARD